MELITEVAQTKVNVVGHYKEVLADALGADFSVSLDDKELTYLLALAASDSYTLSGDCGGLLSLESLQFQNSEGNNMDNNIQFGAYKISKGKHKDKKILAYRGTDLHDKGAAQVTLLQDVSLVLPQVPYLGRPIKEAISSAVEDALQQKPDFICGHSLGGLIAECVCGETGIPGASFNAPAPWSSLPLHNLLSGDKYKDTKFEVHLTEHDIVSLFGGFPGVSLSHVGHPIWHPGVGADDVMANHKMDLMVEVLEKDFQKFKSNKLISKMRSLHDIGRKVRACTIL